MGPSPDAAQGRPTDAEVELLKQLWVEYQYRHDLIWRLLFRVTTAAVILSATPFGINDLAEERAGKWVALLPLAAVLVVLASFMPLRTENNRFQEVKRVYRPELERLSGRKIFGESRQDLFEWFIPGYLALLFMGCVCVTAVAIGAFVIDR
jgi:hypothetical protein